MRRFSHQRPVSPYLNLLEAVQAGFGLTQQQLARLLGVSRTTLTMEGRAATAPGSARQLPSAAVVRLVALQQQLPAPYGPAPVPLAAPGGVLAPDERETLQLRLQKIGLEKYPIEKALARCQARLAQARLRQQALPNLQAALEPDDERGRQQLDYLAQGAALTLRHDAGTPALLELRLRVLAFEAAEIERLLAGA